MDRRRLVAALIVVAIAVPLVVEGMTVLGLVGQYLGDGGDRTPTATPTPAVDDAVGVGDDLLPETARAERVTTATVQSGETWTFTLTVTVENTGTTPYELRLGAVLTGDGQRVAGAASSGTVPPNGSTTVTHQWTLPSGSLPDRVAVTALEGGSGEPSVLIEREVDLAHIPAQG